MACCFCAYLVVAALSNLIWGIEASSGFLAHVSLNDDGRVERLKDFLGYDDDTQLASISSFMKPTYLSLPKNSDGGMDGRAVRYVLHRYFLTRHAWYIKELEAAPDDESMLDESTSDDQFSTEMPTAVRQALWFLERVDNVRLEEVAVLAARIEGHVQSHALELVALAFVTHDVEVENQLSDEEAEVVLATAVMYFVMPSSQAFADDRDKAMHYLSKRLPSHYMGWKDTYVWMLDVWQHSTAKRMAETPFTNSTVHDFSTLSRVMMTIVTDFGRHANNECRQMKNRLLDMDTRQDGRVRLDKFYAPYLAKVSFHFSESPSYLRHLGALDESIPDQPSVIVPNILYSPSNCLGNSGLGRACCIDDCEIVMSEIERHVASPTATPQILAEVVSGISTDTMAAPRNLSTSLLERLQAIADRHGGSVPLHGRLFAQWLHLVFPNECPVPRSVLTSETPLDAQKWAKQESREASATVEEMRFVMEMIESAEDEVDEGDEEASAGSLREAWWSDDEEVLFESLPEKTEGVFRVALRLVVLGALTVGTGGTVLNFYHASQVALVGRPLMGEKHSPFDGKVYVI